MILSLFFLIFQFSFAIESVPIELLSARRSYAFYLENDSRAVGGPGSDQAYTNGFKAAVILNRDPTSRENIGFSFGHQIFTPQNTNAEELLTEDRPYVGWLYLGFSWMKADAETEQILEADVGTVGPKALGLEVQNGFHDLIRSSRARGWKNGLQDEWTLQMHYQKRYLWLLKKDFDLKPYWGLSLGNVLLGTHGGALFRWKLTPDFYFLLGGRGNLVSRNLFLDGNTFQSSHRVHRIPITFETEFGFGAHWKSVNLIWSFVTRSPEFEEKQDFTSFAYVSVHF